MPKYGLYTGTGSPVPLRFQLIKVAGFDGVAIVVGVTHIILRCYSSFGVVGAAADRSRKAEYSR
jgi:hypothetical protein